MSLIQNPNHMIKFGIYMPVLETDANWESNRDTTLLAEKLGFDSVWGCDHPGDARLIEDQWDALPDSMEIMTTLSALASITSKVRLGTCVLSIPYRAPAILAKMATTLDLISNGRLDLGVGTGWNKHEFESFGIDWIEPFSARFERMEEGLEIISKLWTESQRFDFSGQYYHVKHADLNPKPIQKPHPPIWYGGIGKKGIELTGRLCDGWMGGRLTPDDYQKKSTAIRSVAKQYGRDPMRIQMGSYFWTSIDKDFESAAKASQSYVNNLMKHKVDGWRVMESEAELGAIIGGSDECIQRIEEFVKAGVEHFVLMFMPFRREAIRKSMETYAKKVIPHFKSN
jgi:probable F420-dependent oxidoreductase